jgi:hypothetical protein
LNQRKSFSFLRDQLAAQTDLLNLVRDLLPATVSDHCIRAIPHPDTLTLLAESSAWASRLRYLSQELLQRLNKRQFHFKRIQVRVMVDAQSVSPTPTRRQPIPISVENAKLLRSLASSLGDNELKLALQRLSRHTDR